MILLALLLPVVMMAFLFAADALEDLIFPPRRPGRGRPGRGHRRGDDVPLTGVRPPGDRGLGETAVRCGSRVGGPGGRQPSLVVTFTSSTTSCCGKVVEPSGSPGQ